MFIKVTLNSFQGNLEASHVISNEIETKMAKIEGSMTFQHKAAQTNTSKMNRYCKNVKK